MKMLSRKLRNYAWTHWSVGAQYGTPAMTGARILLDNNCNGMVLIPSRAQVELKHKSCKNGKCFTSVVVT